MAVEIGVRHTRGFSSIFLTIINLTHPHKHELKEKRKWLDTNICWRVFLHLQILFISFLSLLPQISQRIRSSFRKEGKGFYEVNKWKIELWVKEV